MFALRTSCFRLCQQLSCEHKSLIALKKLTNELFPSPNCRPCYGGGALVAKTPTRNGSKGMHPTP